MILRLLIPALLVLCTATGWAQETMYVPPGATICFGKGVQAGIFGYLRNGGNISIDSKSNLYFFGKIWMNENGALMTDGNAETNSINGGTVTFAQPNMLFGHLGQQFFESGYRDASASGPSFSNLVVDNSSGVLMTSDLHLYNSLHFRRGHLYLNMHNLVLGDSTRSAKITGYDQSKFVVTGTPRPGGVIKYRSVLSGASAVFPFGPVAANYTPMQIVNRGQENEYFATTFENVYSQATTGTLVTDSTLQVTWVVGKTKEGTDEAVVTLQHDMPAEAPVFTANRAKSYVSLYGNNEWDKPYILNGVQAPGSISSSFPIASALMNTRKVVLGAELLYMIKKVTKAAKAFRIPNAFSPNGDNINDKWNIPGLSEYTNCTVEIFNRYGQMLYRSVGYNQPWDGTFKGAPLAVATYYYLIDLKNGEPPLSGWVVLLR